MNEHTVKSYEEELALLDKKIAQMGGLAEQLLGQSLGALEKRDPKLAEEVVQSDKAIDNLEREIEEQVISMVARRQPMADDLRHIMGALRITTDLERIGDRAVSISERAIELADEAPLKPYIDIPRMAEISLTMLRQSLDAFVREDPELALAVCRSDDEVDKLNGQIFRELLSYMIEDPATITRAMRILFVSKYLERIADHATNIAEMVVFMVKGQSIRHVTVPPAV